MLQILLMELLYSHFICCSLFPQLICTLLVSMALWVIPRCVARMSKRWKAPGKEAVPGRLRVSPLTQHFLLKSRKIGAVERPGVINSTQLYMFSIEITLFPNAKIFLVLAMVAERPPVAVCNSSDHPGHPHRLSVPHGRVLGAEDQHRLRGW